VRRPLRSFVEGGQPTDPSGEVFAQPVLFERVVYGEQHPHAQALNLRGKPFLHFDSAGVVTNEAYDFKGNLLHSTRRLARDYTKAVDWSSVDAAIPGTPAAPLDLASVEAALGSLLEEGGESYLTSTAFDALNRTIRLTTPDESVILPTYNEANLLERVDAHLQGAAQLTPFVTDIDYNAKGQRTLIKYAGEAGSNIEITTTYAYDDKTFRLIRLTTKRYTTEPSDPPRFPDDCPQPPKPGWPGCGLQDLHYTYDPAGNITHIRDDAQQTIFFRQQRVEPSNDYTYDAIYRLIQATGREHLGQTAAGVRLPPTPTSYNDWPRIGLPHPNDLKAMGTYQQSYLYDEVGNIQQMIHVGTDPSNPGWTRTHFCEEDSLLEPAKKSNRLTRTTIGSSTTEAYSTNGDGYDAHGNMLHMPQLQMMQWDFRDQLRLTQRQKANDADNDGDEHQGERTWYVYDASGQRVRKVTVLPAGQLKDERIYLGAFEIYRRRDLTTKKVVRQTLHIMDDKQRIALVETRTQGDDGSPKQLIRYQLGNHLGSATLELDQQARVISYEEYYPYGSTSYQAANKDIKAAAKRHRYTGKERDEESGLYYHGARYYVPWLGRWASCDPAGMLDSTNLFQAVRCNPIRLLDTSGLTDVQNVIDAASRILPPVMHEVATEVSTEGPEFVREVIPGAVPAVRAAPAVGIGLGTIGLIVAGVSLGIGLGYLEDKVMKHMIAHAKEEMVRGLNEKLKEIKASEPHPPREAPGTGDDSPRTAPGVNKPGEERRDPGPVGQDKIAPPSPGRPDKLELPSSRDPASRPIEAAKKSPSPGSFYNAAKRQGGVYVLSDPDIPPSVLKTGRSKDLVSRARSYSLDPETRVLTFEPWFFSNNREVVRGLEQLLHDQFEGAPLNKIRAIALNNPRLSQYIRAAVKYLEKLP
jgi:RHS repeat-associated protein